MRVGCSDTTTRWETTMSKATATFADLPHETLLGICDNLGGDGHGLYDPAFLSKLCVRDELVLSVTQTLKSDTRSPKTTMFDSHGNVIAEQTSVYSLTLYRRINGD